MSETGTPYTYYSRTRNRIWYGVEAMLEELSDLKTERDAQARLVELLREAVDNLADYWQPCEKDETRDYCIVHHVRHCQGMEAYERTRDLLAEIKQAGAG